ncbi:hypothetical protein BVI2075_430107 [Burkholderia vietnamiensis]|nr:hypothetical protein BVI2075_430107 [Burkholderia vietnamiensis]
MMLYDDTMILSLNAPAFPPVSGREQAVILRLHAVYKVILVAGVLLARLKRQEFPMGQRKNPV